MITVTQAASINASSSRTTSWFRHKLLYSYVKIHPKDHKELRLIGGGSSRPGSVAYLRENIGGRFEFGTKLRLTDIAESSFSFRCMFPPVLLRVTGRFTIEETGKSHALFMLSILLGLETSIFTS